MTQTGAGLENETTHASFVLSSLVSINRSPMPTSLKSLGINLIPFSRNLIYKLVEINPARYSHLHKTHEPGI